MLPAWEMTSIVKLTYKPSQPKRDINTFLPSVLRTNPMSNNEVVSEDRKTCSETIDISYLH